MDVEGFNLNQACCRLLRALGSHRFACVEEAIDKLAEVLERRDEMRPLREQLDSAVREVSHDA